MTNNTRSTSVELQTLQTPSNGGSFNGQDVQRSSNETVILGLKPVDKGRDAWMVLMAGFVFEALFWGLSPFVCVMTDCQNNSN